MTARTAAQLHTGVATGMTTAAATKPSGLPNAVGLYDPRNEHDACGVGFIAQMKGVKSHQIVADGLAMLENLEHRGAVGADPLMGDGAACSCRSRTFLPRGACAQLGVDLPPAGDYAVGHIFMPRDEATIAHIEERSCATVRSPRASR
jgi:glutamate synthase (NADPH/NADH) large chain